MPEKYFITYRPVQSAKCHISQKSALIHLHLPPQTRAIPQSSTADLTTEVVMVNPLDYFGLRNRRNSMGGSREDVCRVRKLNSSSVDELPRSRLSSTSRRQNNSTFKPAKDIQSTAMGPYLKPSGTSTSSRKPKDEGPALSDGSTEGDDGADLYIVDREPFATESKCQSSETGAPHGSREV